MEVVAGACPRRRLVLNLSQNADQIASDHEWDPDTKSVEGVFCAEEEDCPEASMMETGILAERIQARARAFASLDLENLVDTFYHRPRLMGDAWSISICYPGGFARDSGRVSLE